MVAATALVRWPPPGVYGRSIIRENIQENQHERIP